MLGTAMPDMHYPSWTLIADGDLVAIHLLVEGTFTNGLMGIPPNGKKMSSGTQHLAVRRRQARGVVAKP